MKLAWTKIALISLLSVIPLAADDEHASTSSPLPSHSNSIPSLEDSTNESSLGGGPPHPHHQQQHQEQQQAILKDETESSHEEIEPVKNSSRHDTIVDTSENDTESLDKEPTKAQHELLDSTTTATTSAATTAATSSKGDDLEDTEEPQDESNEAVDSSSLERDDSTTKDPPSMQDMEPTTSSQEQIQQDMTTTTSIPITTDESKDRIHELEVNETDDTIIPPMEDDKPLEPKDEPPPPPTTTTKKVKEVVVDYASKSTGAIILDKSSEFKGTSKLLVDDTDQYAIAPCHGDETKYVIVGLSEDILIKTIKLRSFERYSSQAKQFEVLGSQTYPMMTEWETLGSWEAKPWFQNNQEQTFDLETPSWARYLKFNFLTHYGDEHYCTVTQIKVHGSTTLQGFHEMEWETIRNEEEEEEQKSSTEEEALEQQIQHDTAGEEEITKPKEEDGTVPIEDEKFSISDNKEEREANNDANSEEKTITQVAADSLLKSFDVETNVDTGEKEQGIVVETQQNKSASEVDVQDIKEMETNTVRVEVEEEIVEEHVESSSPEEPSDASEILPEDDPPIQIEESKNSDIDSLNEAINEEEYQEEADPLPQNAIILESESNGSALSAASIKTSSSKLLENSKETISSTVNSAIKSVKEAHYVNDAMQGLKDIITAKVKSEHLSQDSSKKAVENEEIIHVVQDIPPSDNEGQKGSSDEQIEIVEKDSGSSEQSDSSDGEEEEESQELLENDASTLNEEGNIVGTVMNEVDKQTIPLPASLFELAEKFPSAACLETLTFQHFKSKVVKTSSTGTNHGPGSLAVPKNEPIFKKLADEIKSLQINQGIYDQYIKAATKCYHQIISDMASEIVSLQGEQERRLSQLEEKMREQLMKNEKGFFDSVTKSLFDNVFPLLSESAKRTISFAFSSITMIGDEIVSLIESIMTSKMIQGLIVFLRDYRSEIVSFLAGTLFCFLFVSIYFRLQRIRKSNSNDSDQTEEQAKVGKSAARKKRRKVKKGFSIDQQLPPLEIEELSSRE